MPAEGDAVGHVPAVGGQGGLATQQQWRAGRRVGERPAAEVPGAVEVVLGAGAPQRLCVVDGDGFVTLQVRQPVVALQRHAGADIVSAASDVQHGMWLAGHGRGAVPGGVEVAGVLRPLPAQGQRGGGGDRRVAAVDQCGASAPSKGQGEVELEGVPAAYGHRRTGETGGAEARGEQVEQRHLDAGRLTVPGELQPQLPQHRPVTRRDGEDQPCDGVRTRHVEQVGVAAGRHADCAGRAGRCRRARRCRGRRAGRERGDRGAGGEGGVVDLVVQLVSALDADLGRSGERHRIPARDPAAGGRDIAAHARRLAGHAGQIGEVEVEGGLGGAVQREAQAARRVGAPEARDLARTRRLHEHGLAAVDAPVVSAVVVAAGRVGAAGQVGGTGAQAGQLSQAVSRQSDRIGRDRRHRQHEQQAADRQQTTHAGIVPARRVERNGPVAVNPRGAPRRRSRAWLPVARQLVRAAARTRMVPVQARTALALDQTRACPK